MRRVFFLYIVLSSCLALGAQEKVCQGRVVDAATGEAMPYAQVYVGGGRGAMTNAEGEFCVKVSERDTIRFSYVGYEKLSMEASMVPEVVALKPFSQTLHEIVVEPFDKDSILRRIIGNLRKDYSQNRKERHVFFMRALLRNSEDSYLIENLLTARSAVSLRELQTLSGRFGLNAEGKESGMGLGYTNIQHMAEVAPRTSQSLYWQDAVKPLTSLRTVRKYYDVELQRLHGSEGESLYLITFRLAGQHAKALGQRRYLTGTAYVDAGSLRLLRFDGEVNNASQWVNFKRQPSRIEFRLAFSHADGYTSVQNLAVWGGSEEMKYRVLLYRVGDGTPASSPEGRTERNLLKSVNEAGYDSTLWERYDIVKRTQEEERAASRDRVRTRYGSN